MAISDAVAISMTFANDTIKKTDSITYWKLDSLKDVVVMGSSIMQKGDRTNVFITVFRAL